jgi:hypothetical protein
MLKKRHKPEEIVAKLRQVDVLASQGKSVADAIQPIGVTEVTYYRWRQEFGGLKSDQAQYRCPGSTVVWVNEHSHIYHFPGTRDYGHTKSGAYMCEAEAQTSGNRAAMNERHP